MSCGETKYYGIQKKQVLRQLCFLAGGLKVRSIGARDVSIGSSVDASALRFKYGRITIKYTNIRTSKDDNTATPIMILSLFFKLWASLMAVFQSPIISPVVSNEFDCRVLFCPLLIISVFLESDFQIEKLLVSKMNRMEENQKRKSNSLSETTV